MITVICVKFKLLILFNWKCFWCFCSSYICGLCCQKQLSQAVFCGMQLLIHAWDTCFWHKSPHFWPPDHGFPCQPTIELATHVRRHPWGNMGNLQFFCESSALLTTEEMPFYYKPSYRAMFHVCPYLLTLKLIRIVMNPTQNHDTKLRNRI